MTGEASFHAPYEHCTVKYLEQAGVHPTWINLGAMGVHGNGHMMMLEKNNLQIAEHDHALAREVACLQGPQGGRCAWAQR